MEFEIQQHFEGLKLSTLAIVVEGSISGDRANVLGASTLPNPGYGVGG